MDRTFSPQPNPGILEISPYVGGGSTVPGRDDVLKLSSNENPLGPGDAARDAARDALRIPEVYPASDHLHLRTAIAEVHGLPVEGIVCGAGSDELIALLCRIYAGPGGEVVFTEHGFAMYRISAQAAGAVPVAVPERDRVLDPDQLAAALSDRTRLVFIANPNNPTGTMVSETVVRKLADAIPPTALLVLDGAYAEYVEEFDGGATLVGERGNVVMLRTFSKIHGLASLRVGWAYAPPDVCDMLNRVRGPFNIGAPGLAAAAAAVRDRDHVTRSRTMNARLRSRLHQQLAGLGLESDVSMANFLLIRFESPAEAGAAHSHLLSHGVITRRVDEYNLPSAIRATIGDEAGCRRLFDGLESFRNRRETG